MKKAVIVGATLVVALGLGVLGGAAVAGGIHVLSPAGVTPAEGIQSDPKPAPTYATNDAGETYGSAMDATSPADEPSLIQAVASNGQVGYVRKAELDAADGTTAAASFKSPADAIAWQIGPGAVDHSVNVYKLDGVTVVGTITIPGSASQQKNAEQAPTN